MINNKLIREKHKHKLLKDAKKLRIKMKDIESAKLIREDRNTR